MGAAAASLRFAATLSRFSRLHVSLALTVLDMSTPPWLRRLTQASQKSISHFTKQVVRNYVPVLFYHNKNSQHNLVVRVPRGSTTEIQIPAITLTKTQPDA